MNRERAGKFNKYTQIIVVGGTNQCTKTKNTREDEKSIADVLFILQREYREKLLKTVNTFENF